MRVRIGPGNVADCYQCETNQMSTWQNYLSLLRALNENFCKVKDTQNEKTWNLSCLSTCQTDGTRAISHSKKKIWLIPIRFAHPPADVACAAAISGGDANTGFVTLCMDHEKGRCARDPCRSCKVRGHCLLCWVPKIFSFSS